MRTIGSIILILCVIGLGLMFGGFYYVKNYPYKLYSQWITGKGEKKLYEIQNFKKQWLTPTKLQDLPPFTEDYGQLWREFSLRNTKIPLPVRHPLYQTVPIAESGDKKYPPKIGILILDSEGEEIASIYSLAVDFFQELSLEQDLFKLPYVRNRILEFSSEKVWNDFFSFEISPVPKSLDSMIYDLYLLHLRSKMLPPETLEYGLLSENVALISFFSKDKKSRIELFVTNKNGGLYSFVLKTSTKHSESEKLRAKYLQSISFQPVDPSLGEIIYKEFKQLNFSRQIDQEGMLYLFSAWTQDDQNSDLFKEMIFYLERNSKNERQLAPLYKFGLDYFGKTFTTSLYVGKNENPNITLQRKIELEARGKLNQKKIQLPVSEQNLTPEEKMNLYLKKAKDSKEKNPEEDVIH
jgi:hypothetical protein